MSEINPFKILDFTETEADIYKLLIQLAKTSQLKKKEVTYEFKKVKAADWVVISEYSKSKVYEVIKKLENLELIHIDQARPMSIKILTPKIAIEKLIEHRKLQLTEAGSILIDEINNLNPLQPDIPLGGTAPLSYFAGIDKYNARLDYFLKIANKEIMLICGFLVKGEEEILRKFIAEKLNQGVKIQILYGGTPIEHVDKDRMKFKDYFNDKVISPNKSIIEKYTQNFSIAGGIVGPPLRVTLIDNSEMILAFKKYSKTDERIEISDISGIQSKNLDFVGAIKNIYFVIDNFLIHQLKDPALLKQLIENLTNENNF